MPLEANYLGKEEEGRTDGERKEKGDRKKRERIKKGETRPFYRRTLSFVSPFSLLYPSLVFLSFLLPSTLDFMIWVSLLSHLSLLSLFSRLYLSLFSVSLLSLLVLSFLSPSSLLSFAFLSRFSLLFLALLSISLYFSLCRSSFYFLSFSFLSPCFLLSRILISPFTLPSLSYLWSFSLASFLSPLAFSLFSRLFLSFLPFWSPVRKRKSFGSAANEKWGWIIWQSRFCSTTWQVGRPNHHTDLITFILSISVCTPLRQKFGNFH